MVVAFLTGSYVLRFQEKGSKSRDIPVRHDLEGLILVDVEVAGIEAEAKDRPLFRASNDGHSRPSAEMGNAEHRGADCDLMLIQRAPTSSSVTWA